MSCFDCNGSGYIDAAREKRCPRCNGSGDADRPIETEKETGVGSIVRNLRAAGFISTKKPSHDSECKALAESFLRDADFELSPADLETLSIELAERIQETIEDFIFDCERMDK